MTFTRNEWKEAVEKQRRKRTEALRGHYQQLAQAEVPAKLLTQHAAWNWFIQILSGCREVAISALESIDEEQRRSTDFSHATLAAIQASRLTWTERIRTLDEIMALPAQMIDEAGNARERLSDLKPSDSNGKPDLADAS